ncbi:MAG: ADP-ribosylglycohydrolase family protein [candidate division FCPU426 bacterium]
MAFPTPDQFEGCLLGQALGDAVGYPVEGYPPLICQRYVDDILNRGLAGEWSHYPYPFGQYSDDTQLARELLLSLLHSERFEPEDFAQRLSGLFKTHKIVGQGKATEAAAKRLLLGFSWTDSGIYPPAAGNGSAMRAAPLGLFYFDRPEQLQRAAHDQGRITHRDPRCSAGAVAMAGAVTLALDNQPPDPEAFANQLAQWMEAYDQDFARLVKQLPNWVPLSIDEAFAAVSPLGVDPEYQGIWQGVSPFVVTSVLWSLLSFLRTPEDYWQTICTAIRVGGDVDTTAAMAGAVSGAHLGFSALPQHLVKRLTDQGTWSFDQLRGLAQKLHALKIRLQEAA